MHHGLQMLMSDARIRYWGSRAPDPWMMLHSYRSWLKILNLGSLQASSSTSRLNEVWTQRERERERDEVLLVPFCSQSRSRVPKIRCKFIWSWACGAIIVTDHDDSLTRKFALLGFCWSFGWIAPTKRKWCSIIRLSICILFVSLLEWCLLMYVTSMQVPTLHLHRHGKFGKHYVIYAFSLWFSYRDHGAERLRF